MAAKEQQPQSGFHQASLVTIKPKPKALFWEMYKDRTKFKGATHNQDPKNKISDEKFFREKAQEIYSVYINGGSFYGPNEVQEMQINRDYAQGKQSTDAYKKAFTIQQAVDNQKKAAVNISYEPPPLMPKMRGIIIGKLGETRRGLSINAVDENSNLEIEDMKQDVMIMEHEGDFIKQMEMVIGKKAKKPALPFMPQSTQEYELLAGMGSFKLGVEIALEKLCKATSDRIAYEEIERKLIEDGIDIKYMATKDFINPVTRKPDVRYVDPANLICTVANPRDNTFKDIIDAAEIVSYTLADLKQRGMSDEGINQCLNAYSGQYGNPEWKQNAFASGTHSSNLLNQYRVYVLDGDFMSLNTEFKEIRNVDGTDVLFDLPWGSKKPSRATNQLIVEKYNKRYRFEWVLGTETLLSYGYQDTVVYDDEKPKSAYTVYRVSERSMVELCRPIIDDVTMVALKLRAAVAESAPAGLAIDIGTLAGFKIAGKNADLWDLIKIYNTKGYMLYRGQMNNNGTYTSTHKPVERLEGGVGAYLNELLAAWEFHMNQIRDVTGLSALQDASTPPPGTLVGTARIAEASTNFSLKYILHALRVVKKNTFSNIASRWQMISLLSKYPVSEYYTAFPGAPMEILSISNDLHKRKIIVVVEVDIEVDKLEKLEAACMQSMAAAKTGQIGITMMDYMFISMAIDRGQLKYATLYLATREKKMLEDKLAGDKQAQELNAQIQQQAQKMKDEGENAKIMLKSKTKIDEIKEQGVQDRLTVNAQMKQQAAATPTAVPAPAG